MADWSDLPIQDVALGDFLWEPQDQHCFQLNTHFTLEYWLRIILPFEVNGGRGKPVVGPQREHWLLRRRQSKSADLFHTAVLINISELQRFTEYLFPFFLCSHTLLGTWLNNDYGIDAWICLKSSMASVRKKGGSGRSCINAMWNFSLKPLVKMNM